MNQAQINKITSQKIESTMYQLDKNRFQNFAEMLKYLEEADSFLSDKIQKIDTKIQTVNQQFIRTTSVYEMNNKKRKKQQQALMAERQKYSNQLNAQKQRLSQFTINPITLVLKQKKYELEKLNQTKQIIQEFNKLVKGKEDQIKKILPLDEKNFSNSAMKIYVFKALLEDIHGIQYDNAKQQVNKKYAQLKNKILQNFKQGYWNQDIKLIRNTLPYCEEYQLIDQVSEFYNEQIFKSVHKITKLNCQMESMNPSMADLNKNGEQVQQGQSQIKNMFFLIEQGFNAAFRARDQTTGEINPNQINNIMGQSSEVIGRKLVTFVFQKLIKQSLQNILKASATLSSGTAAYLAYLQIFYDECKKLIKAAQKIIKQDRTLHLMSTYFESIFDVYLDTYLRQQLSHLDQTYQRCNQQVNKQISQNAVNGITQFGRDKQKNNMFSEDKKKTFKQIFFDLGIQSKKNQFTSNNINQQNSPGSQLIKTKIQNLMKIFMNPWLQKIFSTTKKSLARNKKIAKINQVDKNKNQILTLFLSSIQEIIRHLISLISELVPPYDERAPPLQPDFFQLVPQINMLLHRIQFMYEEYKKQNSYKLAGTIKLDQTKQDLMINCGKQLNKVVGEAMATILATQNNILSQDVNQYSAVRTNQPAFQSCSKVIEFLICYIRVIQRITLNNFRNNILKTLGLQFVNHLIKYYSQIPYAKQGLSKIFMDIAKYKTLITQFNNEQIDTKFKILRSLIDIYVMKNQQKAIEEYVKGQPNLNRPQLNKIIQSYILNKLKWEKVQKK